MDKYKSEAPDTWNVDESEVTTVQKSRAAAAGTKQGGCQCHWRFCSSHADNS